MRVGIVSDTHGSAAVWKELLGGLFRDVDLIIHAGDVLYHGPRNPLPRGYDPQGLAELLNNSPVPVVFARGNCDAEIDQLLITWPLQSPYSFLQLGSLRLLVNHGHELSPEGLCSLGSRYRVHVVVAGHTHVPLLKKENGVLFVNPGSPALPKDPAKGPTVALLDPEGLRLLSLETGAVLERARDLPRF